MSEPATRPMRSLRVVNSSPAAPTSTLDTARALVARLDLADAMRHFEAPAHDAVLKTTVSLCPTCLAHVPALVYRRGERIWIRKRCDAHGLSDAVLENDARFYSLSNKDTTGRRFGEARVFDIPKFPGTESCCDGDGCCDANAPTDQMANKTCTILVEVTNACNLACAVCYSDAKGDRMMPRAAFERYMLDLIAKKGGLDSVQLTGGEAVLHPEFWQFVAFLHAHPRVKKVYIPTNGILFARPEVADRLIPYRDKLLVLLQFDGATDRTNQSLRNAQPVRLRERVVAEMKKRGVPMQLTMTLSAGVNVDEVGWVLETARRNEHVKLVAMQPATYSGRYDLAPDPVDRVTLSDIAKEVSRQFGVPVRLEDFVPIPCSHPNCGWITLFVRRFGFTANVARFVDMPKVVDAVAYRTMLSTDELRDVVGTERSSAVKRAGGWLARKLVRSTDMFTIAIKPFMDRFTYDQDRVANCCHHLMDTTGRPVSFCEYNALRRSDDRWDRFPTLPARA